MARLFIDGFEHGDLGLWDTVSAYFSAYQTNAITGDYVVRGASTGGNDEALIKDLVTPVDTVIVAARLSVPTAVTNVIYDIQFFNSSVEAGRVLCSRNGSTWTFSIIHSGSTKDTYVWSSSPYVVHVQAKFINTNATDKRIIVKVDNIERMDESYAQITSPKETTTASIKFVFTSTSNDTIYMDDIVIDDANWPGAPMILGLTPNVDGATNEWTPSTGADNYAVVDEIPANTGDYVGSTTSGEIDLYAFENLPDTDVWSINSVQVSAYAKTPGPPEDEYLQLGVRSGGSNHFGERQQLSTSFAQLSNIFENNPITAAAWTQDEVNSGEFGMKEVS